MRQGLKNRIKFDPNNPTRMSMIKTDYLQRNSFNSRIPNGNCAPTSGCSNVQDASGFSKAMGGVSVAQDIMGAFNNPYDDLQGQTKGEAITGQLTSGAQEAITSGNPMLDFNLLTYF